MYLSLRKDQGKPVWTQKAHLIPKKSMASLLINLILVISHGALSQLVTEKEFMDAATNLGFPRPRPDQYDSFQKNLSTANIETKLEAAMALTQFLHESDGLRAKREYACEVTGCPGQYETPDCDVPGEYYYGRGYIQLSWCYNYRPASEDLYGDDRLVTDPDMVARDEFCAWNTAFWYWKVNVHCNPGVAEGHFGVTTRAINGDMECDGAYQHVARKRFEMYKQVLEAFGLNPKEAIETGCYNLTTSAAD